MPRAVKFDKYGGIDVLRVVEVDRPVPGPEQVLVRIKAAGINPGEAAIREGAFAKQWPATFPSGQGSDLAGIVEAVGSAVRNVAVGRYQPAVKVRQAANGACKYRQIMIQPPRALSATTFNTVRGSRSRVTPFFLRVSCCSGLMPRLTSSPPK